MGAELDSIQKKAKQISEGYGHYFLGTEHLFLAVLLERPFLADLLQDWDVSHGRFVERILEIAERGEGPPLWQGFPVTPRVKAVMKLAEREAQRDGASEVGGRHVVAAILQEGKGIPARVLREFGVELGALRSDVLRRGADGGGREIQRGAARGLQGMEGALDLADIMAEPAPRKEASPPKKEPPPEADARKDKKSVLAQFADNLTEKARTGGLSPVIGRQEEIRRCLQILTRKTKNNPVLIGEAGVGKTSVVMGIAQRIADGKVPEILADRELWELSLTRLVAGASYRGEFQERLQKIMDEVAGNPKLVLFIDEIHQLVGAGDHKGGMDAGNVLKPALARGDFPVIGATTTDEYRKSLESDPALERRFQPVLVNEPSEKECLQILEGSRSRFESHHGVRISDKALLAAVKLSNRFIPDRSLPDKAFDLIDEAASKVRLQQYSMSISPDVVPEFEVGEESVAEVVSLWSGVPVTRLTQEEGERLLHIEDTLRGRVIGQDHAAAIVASTLRVMRMGLGNPNRPAGVFLFLGPTGVGKTELARALAEFLFGSEKDMIRIDMSEYMEKHNIARLIGSPPGYVGHDEEGQLTSAVRTHPYSVVLLDEVEKAHPEVWDLFLQVFDDGRLTDSKGRTVNFTNTILIMTSNVGAQVAHIGDEEVLHGELRKHFRPEFINRIDEIICFKPLGREELNKILDLQVLDVARRVRENRGVALSIEPDARAVLLQKGYSPAYGARPLRRAVQTLLVKPLAEEILRMGWGPGDIVSVRGQGERLLFRKASLDDLDEDPPGDLENRSRDVVESGQPGPRREVLDVPTAPPDLLRTEDGMRPASPADYRPHEGTGSKKRRKPEISDEEEY